MTLVTEDGAECRGMAYLITPEEFAHLDHREKNGYLRYAVGLDLDDGRQVEGLVYVAAQDNAAYLGPASEAAIAHQVARAAGPSGPNRDYVLGLAMALRELGWHDEHVFTIEQELRRIDVVTLDT